MKITVHQELCCEECMEIIHNHIDCPVCNTDYAPTFLYEDIYNISVESITCQVCNTRFKIVYKEGHLENWEYEIV